MNRVYVGVLCSIDEHMGPFRVLDLSWSQILGNIGWADSGRWRVVYSEIWVLFFAASGYERDLVLTCS